MDEAARWLLKVRFKDAARAANREFNRIIQSFWDQFKNCYTKEQKLRLLRQFAERRIANPKTYISRRRAYAGKKKRWKNMGPCRVCDGRPEHRHHIITLKKGGPNKRKNIIVLCQPCHAEIHPWMKGHI